MKKFLTLMIVLGVAGLVSCKKENAKSPDSTPDTPTVKIAPDGFNFKTAKDVNVSIALRTNNGQAITGVVVNVYDPADLTSPIFKAVTDKSGNISAKVSVASSVSQLIIDPAYVGLIRNATATINGASTSVVIGGADGFSGDIRPLSINSILRTNALTTFATSITFAYPSPYKSADDAVVKDGTYSFDLGRPKYLEAKPDNIDASLLENVNASLPESNPVPKSHPEYLSSAATTTLNVVKLSDVWITYVSEGAGFRNSLAFYTYKTGSAPTKVTDIKNATYVFPNASGYGSAGGLKPGDKVNIGRFEAGTSIGFILLQNAWNGSKVDLNGTLYFSQYELNPEADNQLKKHSIVLFDAAHKLFLIGFEDLPRDKDSDNDFNDLVFYATSNPVTGISQDGVPPADTNKDEDGDGVRDSQDAFPQDPEKAYITYFPSEKTNAQVAFEDNWPQRGDYDMNDLVVNYRYTFIKNAKNEVVSLTGDYSTTAAGASYKNGFGIQLPLAASLVKSVSGTKAISNYIKLAANGVEAGQKRAVIIPFDNHDAVLKYNDGAFFVNTLMNKDKITGTPLSVTITFTSPVSDASLSPGDFNPFLISNLRRGYEVHLPGYVPTDLADAKLFGTDDDKSSAAANKYYLSKENGPWAISYNSAILYPMETVDIRKAYPHFAEWALSAGASFTDWYSNITSGYRDNSLLYTK